MLRGKTSISALHIWCGLFSFGKSAVLGHVLLTKTIIIVYNILIYLKGDVTMSVYRIYVEKKPEFAVEASSLIGDIKSALGLEELEGLRVINRYDAQGMSKEDFDLATPVVFSEPAVDYTYDHLPQLRDNDFVFAVEYLPGQFDQRADSCAQCISLLTGGKRPSIRSARIYIVTGNLSDEQVAQIKSYMINPVESREAGLEPFETLDIKYAIPTTVETIDGFIEVMHSIAREAQTNPDEVKGAPHSTPIGRVDDVLAAKNPVLTWKHTQA